MNSRVILALLALFAFELPGQTGAADNILKQVRPHLIFASRTTMGRMS
jgi:hypothetical protein